MRAPLVGIVEEDDIAFLQALRKSAQRGEHAEVHRGEVHRDIGRLPDQVCLGIKESVRKIDHVIENRGITGLLQVGRHQSRDVIEPGAYDGECNRVEGG